MLPVPLWKRLDVGSVSVPWLGIVPGLGIGTTYLLSVPLWGAKPGLPRSVARLELGRERRRGSDGPSPKEAADESAVRRAGSRNPG
jgi:hypothetical protein